MFVKVDKTTQQEVMINSEEMVRILERDLKDNLIDDVLTDIVCGSYEHSDAMAIYKYKS